MGAWRGRVAASVCAAALLACATPRDAGRDASAIADAAAPDASADADAGVGELRMIAPMSGAFVTTRRPTLRWTLPPAVRGAHVELCSDSSCAAPFASFDVEGDRGSPAADLDPGVVFWRACALDTPLADCPMIVRSFRVPRRSAPIDTSWGTLPDFDHDGASDLLIGQPGTGMGLIMGYSGGPSGPTLVGHNAVLLLSTMAPRGYGRSVAIAGDVIGTGHVAFLGGAIGKAFLDYYFHSEPDREIPTGGSDEFGFAVAGAGDVDGDGFADMLFGTSTDSRGGTVALLHYGGDRSGIDGSEIPVYHGGSSGYVVPSMDAAERFSRSVSTAGDVDGDGLSDVIVGAPGADRAYVWLGEPTRPPSRAPIVLQGPVGSHFGASVACAGDVDGDGLADVIVGAPLADRAFVFLGHPALGIEETPVELGVAGVTAADLGVAVAGAGDVDGDGYFDVIVGAPAAALGFGRAYVFSGGAAGLSTTPSAELAGMDPSGADFGRAVAGLGDLDRDGFDDVAVGVPGAPPDLRGATYVFRGAGGAIETTPRWRLDGHDGGYTAFGTSIARAL